MNDRSELTVAYTPDSDDAFYFDAIEQGLVSLPGYRFRMIRQPMSHLNQAVLQGQYDVTAISSVVYPLISHQYAILSVGTSVGRGYGPVLVSRKPLSMESLAGRRVGVPGIPTTGWFLLRLFCPDAIPVVMPFDRIAEAVADDRLAAGVMIHEELLYYPQFGLTCVVDLGAEWCSRFQRPLPVGLNVIRRDLGQRLMRQICGTISESLQFAREFPEAALNRVARFGRGAEGGVTRQFVEMFANDDSQSMPEDVRNALPVLFAQAHQLGVAPFARFIDIIEPALETARAA